MDVTEGVGLKGVITIRLFDAGTNELVACARHDNKITTVGLAAVAQGINWAGIQDQAANLGYTTPTVLSPLYGAVGTGTSVPSAGDTQLGGELARVTVSQAASSNGQLSWTFFFPTTVGNGTISEAGVFVQAASATNSGVLLDRVLISPTVTKTSAQTMTLSVAFTVTST